MGEKKINNFRLKRNILIGGAITCIAVATIVGTINAKIASKANLEVATKGVEDPKSITTPIKAGTPNKNNVTFVDSKELDENSNPKKVPVPKGYVASPLNTESYINGVMDTTWKKQEELTYSSQETRVYYNEKELTLASPESEQYKWTYNETAGAWQSENKGVNSSTSTIESNTFTLSEAGKVSINWSVSSEGNCDYGHYTITNTTTGETVKQKTDKSFSGTSYGTAEGSLTYSNIEETLGAGTYKITIKYTKDGSGNSGLDRLYVKSVKVLVASAEPTENYGITNYAWSYDSSLGVWKSGNKNVSNSTSMIESNNFTVGETAKVRIVWSVSSEATNDYAYYTITNTSTGAIIGGTSTKISGTGSGTAEGNLKYKNEDVDISEGTYKIEIKYIKNASRNTGLDSGYLKSISVYTESGTGETLPVRAISGGFVIYERLASDAGKTDAEVQAIINDDIDVAQRTRMDHHVAHCRLVGLGALHHSALVCVCLSSGIVLPVYV